MLFFTSATGPYLPFLPLYVYFARKFNSRSVFEFIIDDDNIFLESTKRSIDFLRKRNEIHLRGIPSSTPRPEMDNSLRFIIQPELRADFVYIGDIDIFILEDIMSIHRPIFDAGLPYSNIIRAGSKRMSGLHLTRFDAYYPIIDVSDIVASTKNDEEILYKILERSGIIKRQSEIDSLNIGRTTHGIHLSLNRIPFCHVDIRVDWRIKWKFVKLFESVTKEPDFDDFVDSLSVHSRMYLANLVFLHRGISSVGEEVFVRFTGEK